MSNWNNIYVVLKNFLKKDILMQIGAFFFFAGMTFLVASNEIHIAYVSASFSSVLDIKQSSVWGESFLGIMLLLTGSLLFIIRAGLYLRTVNNSVAALFFFVGMKSQNDSPPEYALLPEDRIGLDRLVHKVNSYIPQNVLDEYQFWAKTISERVSHSEASKGYVAALGSIPSLYAIGTLFRNGHLPLFFLEHNRSIDRWHPLDEIGSYKKLNVVFNEYCNNSALENVRANSNGDIGVAISFTNQVLENELPESLRGHTLFLELDNVDKKYDALPVESNQIEIAKKISHIISVLNKKENVKRTHLFICAQSTFVVNLGRLYQDNMTGEVVIHNYDSIDKNYPWALSFDRDLKRYKS